MAGSTNINNKFFIGQSDTRNLEVVKEGESERNKEQESVSVNMHIICSWADDCIWYFCLSN